MNMTVNPHDLYNDLEDVRLVLGMWQSDIEDELKDPAEGSEAYWKRQAAIARLALAAIERWQRAALAVIQAGGELGNTQSAAPSALAHILDELAD